MQTRRNVFKKWLGERSERLNSPVKKANGRQNMKNIYENWMSGVTKSRTSRNNSNSVTLKPHQTKVRDMMKRDHSRVLAIHGTGSGKTYMALKVAKDYLDLDPKNIVIVITPANISSGFISSGKKIIGGRPGVYYITYGQVRSFLDNYAKTHHTTFGHIAKRALIIADEAHYITGQLERIFVTVFSKANKVLLMTATPMKNGSPKDLLPMARILNPTKQITGDPVQYFRCKVSVYNVPQNSSNFPTMNTSTLNIPLTNAQMNTYKTEVGKRKFRINTLLKAFTGRATPNNQKIWAIHRSAMERVFPNVTQNPKFVQALDIIRQRPYRTIIYFQEYVTLDNFKAFLKKSGVTIPIKTISGRERNFKPGDLKDPFKKCLFLITSAAKEGLDFKGVRTIIFIDLPWTKADYDQIIGRAKRYQSHKALPLPNRDVRVFKLLFKNSINTRSNKAIENKKQSTDKMMHDLELLSIEKNPCAASSSPRRQRSPSPPNRRMLSPTVRGSPTKNYGITAGTGNKVYAANVNIPYSQLLRTRKTNRPIAMLPVFKKPRKV